MRLFRHRAIAALLCASAPASPMGVLPPPTAELGTQMVGEMPHGETAATPVLPTSPAGARAIELFHILKSGDRRAARAYLLGSTVRSESEQDIQSQLYELGRLYLPSRGNLTVVRIKDLGPSEAAIIYRDGLLQLNRALVVTVEPSSPYRIISWDRASAGWGTDGDDAPLADTEAGKAVDEYASKLAAADYFSGTILLARDGRVVLHKSYGLADRNHQIPNRNGTRYNVASIVKMFTAAAVLQLAEKGLLSVDDPIEKYVPEYLPAGAGQRVLLRHLLSHTSGLRGKPLQPLLMGEASLRLNSHSDVLNAVNDREKSLQFTPGTQHVYSNHGYMLLGRVIEVVSGKDYYEYVRDHLFHPAGMVDTGFPEMELVVPRQAVGYETFWRDTGPHVENNWLRIPARGLASGGAYSTTADLLRFAAALRAGKLVRMDTLRMMTSPAAGSPEYGYGFSVRHMEGNGRTFGHTGDMAGVCGTFDVIEAEGGQATVIVLSNSSMGSCRPVHDKILQLL